MISLLTLVTLVLRVLVAGSTVQPGSQLWNYQSQLIDILEKLLPHLPSIEELSLQATLYGIASIEISIMISALNGLINARTTTGTINFRPVSLLPDAAGIAGMLLGNVPAMVLKIILESSKETKWIARLMDPTGNEEEGKKEEGRKRELEL